MNTRPWLISAVILLGLTVSLWSNVNIAMSFGGAGDFLTFDSGPLNPHWEILTFANPFASTSTTPTTGTTSPSQTPTIPIDNTPVPPLVSGNIPYTPAVNVFPAVDKTKQPQTTISLLLATSDAKAMEDQIIPKEGSKSPSGLTFSLDTFAEQKQWARTIDLDPSWKDRAISLAESTYHPCCGVTVATNDCGHAIALTGLIKKLVRDGRTDDQIRSELLMWEEYYFPRHYVIMGLALKKANEPLSHLDVSANYSTVQSESFATDYLTY